MPPDIYEVGGRALTEKLTELYHAIWRTILKSFMHPQSVLEEKKLHNGGGLFSGDSCEDSSEPPE